MPDESSLLSFIARYHTYGREDVATDALSYILSHSHSARRIFRLIVCRRRAVGNRKNQDPRDGCTRSQSRT